MPIRRSLPETTIWDFFDEFLVHCPRCRKNAVVHDRGKQTSPRIILTCANCGYNAGKDAALRSTVYRYTVPIDENKDDIIIGAPIDPYFHQRLWLQSPCCGQILWFYNHRHVQWVEDYVRSTLRERKPYPYYRKNNTMSSRLPTWMKKANHREPILRAIKRMKTQA